MMKEEPDTREKKSRKKLGRCLRKCCKLDSVAKVHKWHEKEGRIDKKKKKQDGCSDVVLMGLEALRSGYVFYLGNSAKSCV